MSKRPRLASRRGYHANVLTVPSWFHRSRFQFATQYFELMDRAGSSNGGVLCVECYTLIHAHGNSEVIPAPEFGHQQVCFGCGRSILRTRSYRVSSECPEINVILRLTPAHQVSRLEKDCAACRRAANREVQRQQQNDSNGPELQEINDSINETGAAIPELPSHLIRGHIPWCASTSVTFNS